MAFEWQMEPFFRELLDALWFDEESVTFAAGGNIIPAPRLESIAVEGVGLIQLPLSVEDVPKLVNVCEQAPYGHGLATVVNTNVRRAWQVDSSKVTFPSMPQFVTKSIQVLANNAVRALELHREALQLEAHFYKLLLYEAGGHFARHRDTEKEPGMFATLIVQLPTQGGFEGGPLVIHHSGVKKTYDFSKESSTGFSYTAFFADCEHELQRITSGTRLCLAFNLVRAHNSFGMQLGFSLRSANVEDTLRPWLEAVTAENSQGQLDQGLPSKLAIPLEHKYTKKNLSFARLKGEDGLIAQVLKSCRDGSRKQSLELHLCILTKHQTGDPSHDDSYGYRHRRRYDEEDDDEDADHHHVMERVHEEDFEPGIWVGTGNKPCSFTVDIDVNSEVVMYDDENPFEDGGEPDKVEYEENTGNAGPTLEYWYHKAMIVIWPRTKTFKIACKLGLSAVLDILESRLAEKDSDFSTLLQELLVYCKHNSGTLLGPSEKQVTNRFFELCLAGGALEDVLSFLRLLSEPLQYGGQRASEPAVSTSVGIGSANLGTTILKAVQKHGWDNCGTYIMGLLKQHHVTLQGKFFGQLALDLEQLGLYDAGLLVARRTFELLFLAPSSFGQLEAALVCTMTKMIFTFKECLEEVGLMFVNLLTEVNTKDLCSSVNIVISRVLLNEQHFTQQEVCTGDGVNGASVFTRICEMVTGRDFHSSKGAQGYIVHIVESFYFLAIRVGIEQHFKKLIQTLVGQSRRYRQEHLLKALVDADSIWKALSGSALGQRGLQVLAEEVIQQVSTKKKPVFNWCMPFANFPHHPVVEAFLRGPRSSLIYTGVNDFNHAINFTRKYFSAKSRGKCQDGYSATGEAGGQGGEAYCLIKKTPVAFEELVQSWEKEQLELSGLRARVLQMSSTQPARSSRNSVVVLSPDSSTPHHDKKQKIDKTEYVDLTLDDE